MTAIHSREHGIRDACIEKGENLWARWFEWTIKRNWPIREEKGLRNCLERSVKITYQNHDSTTETSLGQFIWKVDKFCISYDKLIIYGLKEASSLEEYCSKSQKHVVTISIKVNLEVLFSSQIAGKCIKFKFYGSACPHTPQIALQITFNGSVTYDMFSYQIENGCFHGWQEQKDSNTLSNSLPCP